MGERRKHHQPQKYLKTTPLQAGLGVRLSSTKLLRENNNHISSKMQNRGLSYAYKAGQATDGAGPKKKKRTGVSLVCHCGSTDHRRTIAPASTICLQLLNARELGRAQPPNLGGPFLHPLAVCFCS